MSKTAFLFPGQGAQHIGMGGRIREESKRAAELFDEATAVLGFDLSDVCSNGPEERLNSTVVSQPALFVASLAALELLKQNQPEVVDSCELAAGLSLGEYTALVFAGCMTFEDGLRVVKRRGEAMQAAADANPSTMASILMLEREQVEEIVAQASEAGSIRIANYLCPGNLIVSGEIAACDKAVEIAEEAGAKTVKLAVAGAFHTDLMKPADEQLAEALSGVQLKSPQIPVYSNVDAATHSDPEEIRELLVKQVLSPVRWEDSVRAMLEAGADQFYEIGPGRVLKGLLKRISRRTPCENVNDS